MEFYPLYLRVFVSISIVLFYLLFLPPALLVLPVAYFFNRGR